MTDEATSPLRQRMIEDMTIRKLTPKTQHDYVQRVKNFATFLGRSPDTASFEDVRRYQLHLVAWAAKFKKFARLAGVNELKKNCHGVRKARAEVAAYSECTEAQMMAMFGWRDHKMPALYIAKANRDKLAISGMEKIEAYDQMENTADLAMPTDQNRIVTFESNRRKKP